MKIVNIKRLQISNFKGIYNLDLDLNKKSISILGKNESGKTSIVDAIHWLLDGKNSANTEKFPIKNIHNSDLEADSKIVSVTAVFDIQDSDEVKEHSFTRELHENWAAEKRGSANRILKGHITKYVIDTIPVDTEREFIKRFEELLPESSVFKMLFNTNYFSDVITWKERRDIIEKIIGEVTDEDILNISPGLSHVVKLITEHPIADVRKRTTSAIKEVVEKMDHSPALIKELSDQIATINSENDFEYLKIQIEEKNKIISDAEASYLDFSKKNETINNSILKLREDLFKLNSDRSDKISLSEKEFKDQDKEILLKISSVEDSLSRKKEDFNNLSADIVSKRERFEEKVKSLKDDIESKTKLINLYNDNLGDLREKFKSESNKTLEFKEGECSLCGAFHKAGEITKDRAEALEAFQISKTNTLNSINKEGLIHKQNISRLEKEISDINEEIDKCDIAIVSVEQDYKEKESNLLKEIDMLEKSISDLKKEKDSGDLKTLEFFTSKNNVQKLDNEISEVNLRISELESKKENSTSDDLKQEIAELKAELSILVNKAAKQSVIPSIEKRINSLKEDLTTLQNEKSRLEGIIYNLSEYERIKYTEIESRANNIFKVAKVQMFLKQINGGYEPVCEITDNGVPFKHTNTAARVQLGMDVIQTLSKYYGYCLPIFIDNRESTTSVPNVINQVINLKVSDKYDKPTVVNE